MTEITDHDQHPSPSVHDDALGGGNGNGILNQGGEPRGIKRSRPSNPAEDDDDDDDKPGRERRKIEIKFIQDKSRRHITFSKRKAGIMKKVSRIYNPASVMRQPPSIVMAVACSTMLMSACPGLRAICPDRHPSPPTRRVRDRSRLYLYHTKASAARHKT